MVDPNSDASKKVAPSENVTTKVNVAFPFSKIAVEEPSEELVQLAALVRELADVLNDVAPGPRSEELARRAEAIATRLKS